MTTLFSQHSVTLLQESHMKSLFATKTFWVNFVSGVVAFLEGQDLLNIVPDPWEPTIAAVVFALNIVLRYITTQPVKPLLGGENK